MNLAFLPVLPMIRILPIQFGLRILLAPALILVVGSATVVDSRADDAPAEVKTLNPPQDFLVIKTHAIVMRGNERGPQVSRGQILSMTRARGPWRYSPEQRGWIHTADLASLSDAVETFTREIEKTPTAAAYHLRGVAWMAQGEWAKAHQDLEKAYDLGEGAVSLHYNLGICLQRLGNNALAIQEFDSILKNFPDEAPSLIARGEILLDQGQHAAALRDFSKAVDANPESVSARHGHGVALRMLGRYLEAIESYSEAIKRNPRHVDALANRAFARKSLGDFAAALADYDAALAIDPQAVEIQNDLAWLLATCPKRNIRNPDRAIELAENVCDTTDNRNAEYLDTLAAAYASAERYDAAVEAARLAETLLTDEAVIADVQERLKRYQARQPYVETLELPSVQETEPTTDDAEQS